MKHRIKQSIARTAVFGLFTASFSGLLYAQSAAQKISGPQARYWLNAETSTGMGAMMAGGGSGGGLGSIFGAMMGGAGGGGGPTKSLRLDLGAARDANPASGQHTIPAGMSMGASLPLAGPERAAFEKRERDYERDVPEVQESDGNMRMLFFWGCGAEAGPGQPVILDMKQIQQGRMPPNMRGYAVRDRARGPGYGRDRGYADWPNGRDNTQVPSAASLVGDHQVSSNISPEIRFAVAASHDFLGGLTLSSSPNAAGGTRLSWNNLDRALGYAATAMGQRETAPKQSDMVMWTSSAQRMLGGQELMGFLPPAEVQRLVGERVVMPAGTTECVIPKQAVEAAGGQMLMSSLNAFGPELNHIHPPRPQDARVEWKQEYAVKLRTRSHTTAMDGMGGASERSRPSRGGSTAQPAPQAPAPAEGGQVPGLPPVGNILRGIFGR
jgi:hypothetical protein